MKFTTTFATLIGAALVMAAPATLEQRDDIQGAACRAYVHTPFRNYCGPFFGECEKHAKTSTNLWSNKGCVAAAVCYSIESIHDLAVCENPTSPPINQTASLDYNLYASIVGDCAWSKNGCPITQQNFVDFYYGTLSSLGATVFPTYKEVIDWVWTGITTWTNTGNTVPYLNFNDFLHYSNGPFTPRNP